MAVTYAWRLDANKFAYILSPDGEEGYVSQTIENTKPYFDYNIKVKSGGNTAFVFKISTNMLFFDKFVSNSRREFYDLL